ncbi:transcriptional regulator [Sinomonas sp. ASV322]|uniref:helix-turn-helix transcriptional regulator n=1 Tax=Sinomonas sp. ASV322 TaxID=3041920 RepID=UPI0027DB3ABB|nr:transcriptional regulator [Sinomonas sp. ASV322]MDQ4503281.1 transcriptional regulator [Sinomonas sp. ASV322]
MAESPWSRRVQAVSSLGDRSRRAIFDYVRAAARPVGRDEAADALGMTRGAAAAQLDRLASDGILAVTFVKPGAGGPGTGRPSKFYALAVREVVASVPERNYELAGELMAEAAERSMTQSVPIEECLDAVGRETGNALGREHGSIEAVLEAAGYSPVARVPEGTIELANCPFHRLAQGHRAVVCALSAALLEGALEGCGDARRSLEPIEPGHGAGECCARIMLRKG